MRVQSLIKLSLAALCSLPLMARADVFINEIHYDTPGNADVDETIEIVGTAGEDLSQYRIVLYNGNGGAFYRDVTMPAGSTVTCGSPVSISSFNFTLNSGQIQNGAPDGMALVGPGSAVVQFLSYEGTFTAADGPATGMTSIDIGVSEDNIGPTGQSLQLAGNGSGYSDFSWQGEATNTFNACNNGQTFTGGVDVPPTLASSIPANNAPAFPTNADLQISFSEPVDLGATWFQIVCSLSGTRNVMDTVVSGSNAVYSINPTADFDQTETCTMTLDAAQITDRGGMAQALGGPNTINFTISAPAVNDPPVVLATTPITGDSNFPAAGNLTAMFSEPVNLLANAFTLSCGQSGSVALTYPASGMSFSISTGTALIGGESCTFTIVADRVTDVEGAELAANYVVTFTVRTGGVGTYYDRVNTSSPEQLRCSLHETIKGHTRYPYGWTQLEIADEAPDNVCAAGGASSADYILDVYRNRCYRKVTDRSGSTGPGFYNREHTWPKSLGFNNSNLAPHNDQHMLHLSASDHNSTRDNDPYDNCTTGCTAYGTDANNGVGGAGPERGKSNWSDGTKFEVWDVQKGDMARAVMYMAIRYEGIASEDAHDGDVPDLELTDNRSLIVGTSNTAAKAYMGILSTLLQWHQQDPVDARELDRNEVIFNFQSNRNPFIDHPEWATLALFQSSQPATCVLGSGSLIFADGFGN